MSHEPPPPSGGTPAAMGTRNDAPSADVMAEYRGLIRSARAAGHHLPVWPTLVIDRTPTARIGWAGHRDNLVRLGAAVADADPTTRRFVMAHELSHHLRHAQLRRPTLESTALIATFAVTVIAGVTVFLTTTTRTAHVAASTVASVVVIAAVLFTSARSREDERRNDALAVTIARVALSPDLEALLRHDSWIDRVPGSTLFDTHPTPADRRADTTRLLTALAPDQPDRGQ